MSFTRSSTPLRRWSAATAGLVLASSGLALPAQADSAALPELTTATVAATPEGVRVNEVHFLGPDSEDFIEIAAPAGTDIGGWSVGTVTRGGNPQSAAHVATVAEGTTVPENGIIAVDVPITNATTGGWGSSAFVVTDEGDVVGFHTAGRCVDHQACDASSGGIIAGTSNLLPAALHGAIAEPTSTLPGSAQESLQWVEGSWTAAPPTRGEPNAGGEAPEPGDPVTATIAEAWDQPIGTLVETTGVVTAHYPQGGFNGYVIQTPGTGGDADLSTRTTSDALFVYSPQTVGRVEIGDHLSVTGLRAEFNGLQQLSTSGGADQPVTELSTTAEPVLPVEDFVLPADQEGRLAFQNMLVHPADRYVVSDVNQLGGFNNAFGSIGLGLDGPLVQESELANPVTEEDSYRDLVAQNAARAVTLDDGRSAQTPSSGEIPYLTGQPDVRTGVGLDFQAPVIVDYRFQWNFQPTAPVEGSGTEVVEFAGGDTRAANAAPQSVGGDISLANFNVLNYFTTLGADLPACSNYGDRDGVPLTVNRCTDPDPGPRGAWDQTSLDRQEGKIVAAINTLDADVVALSEIENSAAFGLDRDASLKTLVDALNTAPGADREWAFVPSPAAVPGAGVEDVIRNAFIYRVDTVSPAGESTVLLDQSGPGQPFSNAREPLAQAFTVTDSDYEFLAIANHFKSKSCSGYDGEDAGQGCWNGDRVAQATALAEFSEEVAGEAGIDDIFLLGDFNAYSAEDPLRTLEAAGFENVNDPWDPAAGEYTASNTYVFDGKTGSLDHIFASEPSRVTGTEVWSINANESILAEYSRFNNFASGHFEAGTPFRASDHDPVKIGIDVPGIDGPTDPEPTTPTPSEPEPTVPSPSEPEPTVPSPSASEPTVPSPSASEPTDDGSDGDAGPGAPGDPTGGDAAGPGGDLPRTGGQVAGILLAAVLLLAVGAGLLAVRRHRAVA